MRLWPFGSKGSKLAAPVIERPRVIGADGNGELIISDHPAVYDFRPMLEVSPATKARDDELVAALMAMETCDVCTLPMNVCQGHYWPYDNTAERSN